MENQQNHIQPNSAVIEETQETELNPNQQNLNPEDLKVENEKDLAATENALHKQLEQTKQIQEDKQECTQSQFDYLRKIVNEVTKTNLELIQQLNAHDKFIKQLQDSSKEQTAQFSTLMTIFTAAFDARDKKIAALEETNKELTTTIGQQNNQIENLQKANTNLATDLKNNTDQLTQQQKKTTELDEKVDQQKQQNEQNKDAQDKLITETLKKQGDDLAQKYDATLADHTKRLKVVENKIGSVENDVTSIKLNVETATTNINEISKMLNDEKPFDDDYAKKIQNDQKEIDANIATFKKLAEKQPEQNNQESLHEQKNTVELFDFAGLCKQFGISTDVLQKTAAQNNTGLQNNTNLQGSVASKDSNK